MGKNIKKVFGAIFTLLLILSLASSSNYSYAKGDEDPPFDEVIAPNDTSNNDPILVPSDLEN